MRMEVEVQCFSTYVGWSSQVFDWWLLELLEELPRSAKHK